MKRMAKMTALVLLALVLLGLCAAAVAEVEEVTITINVVDSVTGEPLDKQIILRHSQCIYWKYHEENNEECDCFDDSSAWGNNWFMRGLTPCDCGEIWSPHTQSTSSPHTGTGTFTIKTGHKYLVSVYYNVFGYGEHHVRPRPAPYIYADPETGELSFVGNGVELSMTDSTTFRYPLVNRVAPVEVNLNATKLMDGEDPGEQVFSFKVWQVTESQMQEYFDISNLIMLLKEDELPEWKEEYEEMDFYEFVQLTFTPKQYGLILERLTEKLDKLPHTIVSSSGKTVPILNRTFSPYDFEQVDSDSFGIDYNFIIAEVQESGNGVCEDKVIYGVTLRVGGFYPTLPSNLEDDMTPPTHIDQMFDVQHPMHASYWFPMAIHPELGFGFLDGEVTEEEIAEMFVFRNTTCPYADPAPTEVPEVPATADGGFPIYWAALLLVGVMVMILRPRRA